MVALDMKASRGKGGSEDIGKAGFDRPVTLCIGFADVDEEIGSDDCSGPMIDIAARLTNKPDLIVSGHSHTVLDLSSDDADPDARLPARREGPRLGPLRRLPPLAAGRRPGAHPIPRRDCEHATVRALLHRRDHLRLHRPGLVLRAVRGLARLAHPHRKGVVGQGAEQAADLARQRLQLLLDRLKHQGAADGQKRDGSVIDLATAEGLTAHAESVALRLRER